uniref:Uncharacterized protein n=1 Tax=Anguilla anguilla TaxID=7936 RepID=A0A0E9QNX3_ANGAN
MAYLLPGLIGLLKPFVTLACLYSPAVKGPNNPFIPAL